MHWYLEGLRKYADFSGRARRKEYWLFTLFNFLINVVLGVVDAQAGLQTATGFGILSGVYTLGVLIPSLAVLVRRLHDTDRRGWWMLIVIVPLIGPIALLYFLVSDSDPGKNRFGRNPKKARKAPAVSGLEDPAVV